jgi:hypothetical protein
VIRETGTGRRDLLVEMASTEALGFVFGKPLAVFFDDLGILGIVCHVVVFPKIFAVIVELLGPIGVTDVAPAV